MRYMILDVETTGLLMPKIVSVNAQPHIIELGALMIENGQIVDSYNQLFDPHCKLSPEVKKITGIKDSDLKGQPPFKRWLYSSGFKEEFFAVDVLIAHNAQFDVEILKLEYERADVQFVLKGEVICTIDYYERYFGKRPTLKQLYKNVVGRALIQKHRAADDVEALHEILVADGFYKKRGLL